MINFDWELTKIYNDFYIQVCYSRIQHTIKLNLNSEDLCNFSKDQNEDRNIVYVEIKRVLTLLSEILHYEEVSGRGFFNYHNKNHKGIKKLLKRDWELLSFN